MEAPLWTVIVRQDNRNWLKLVVIFRVEDLKRAAFRVSLASSFKQAPNSLLLEVESYRKILPCTVHDFLRPYTLVLHVHELPIRDRHRLSFLPSNHLPNYNSETEHIFVLVDVKDIHLLVVEIQQLSVGLGYTPMESLDPILRLVICKNSLRINDYTSTTDYFLLLIQRIFVDVHLERFTANLAIEDCWWFFGEIDDPGPSKIVRLRIVSQERRFSSI